MGGRWQSWDLNQSSATPKPNSYPLCSLSFPWYGRWSEKLGRWQVYKPCLWFQQCSSIPCTSMVPTAGPGFWLSTPERLISRLFPVSHGPRVSLGCWKKTWFLWLVSVQVHSSPSTTSFRTAGAPSSEHLCCHHTPTFSQLLSHFTECLAHSAQCMLNE